ncbi:MAG: F0F1 ATP synthase subunit epsilon [Gemmatimonadota bacterium]|nr:F0F1 ATP synthase subunit epsilon [Gemmatimonadota bacterium]
MPAFALEVVTPERVAYSGQVASLQAPGSEGSFGVLAGHIPLLTSLQIGRLRFVEEDGNEVQMAISGGFVEVGREQVAVLAETAERVEEIDVARAEAARQRAEERLARAREERVDVARAEAALARAINRLRTSS